MSTTIPDRPGADKLTPRLNARSRTPGSGRWARLGLLATILALATLNGWWSWGDRMTPTIKQVDALIASGQLVEAEQALATRLRWSSGDGEARMNRARLLIKRGDTIAGAEELHRVPAWWPSRREASFLEGQAFKMAARARDAEAAWRTCLVADPLHPTPSSLLHGSAKELVTLAVLEGRLDEARAVLWRVYEESNALERPEVLATRVRAEVERIDHDEAIAKLRAFTQADPADLDALRALAIEEHATSDEAGCDRDLAACLAIRSDDPATWRARLEILHDRGDVDTLHQAITALPASTQEDGRIWMYRGIDRQRLEDPAGAIEAFRRSAGLAPTDPEVLYKLGLAEVAAGQQAEGRDHLASSQELRRAYGSLRDGYYALLEQVRRFPRDQAAYRSAVEGVAANLRTLGFAREADAWLAQLPRT